MNTNDLHQKIADKMFNGTGTRRRNPFPAGYTYLGQFISHEIIPSTMQRTLSRKVSGYMNLESLYGSAPLYEYKYQPESLPFFTDSGEFKLNSDDPHDLPRIVRGDKYIALIPEARNDENQILAQFHLLLMRLHNTLITKKFAQDALEARLYTTLLFQLVVIEDFLKRLLTNKVHSAVFEENRCSIHKVLAKHYPLCGAHTFIPTIFSHASWRFGHSNVLSRYHLDNISSFKLSDLLKPGRPVPHSRKISWSEFFDIDENFNPQLASSIDTKITSMMKGLSGAYFKNNIVALNLAAAERISIPPGAELVKQLAKSVSNWTEISNELDIQASVNLRNSRFESISGLTEENLPLWLHILLEAETHEQSLGAKLGPLGSLLNASVIKQSIMGADISIFSGDSYSYPTALTKLGKLADVSFIQQRKITMANIIKFIDED